jgi:chaperone modulatory protein CbpM
MRTSEFLMQVRLEAGELHAWIEAGWLRPLASASDRDSPDADFSEVDVARARLIRDLRNDVGLNDEAIPVVLDLIDQIHGLRRVVRELLAARGDDDLSSNRSSP